MVLAIVFIILSFVLFSPRTLGLHLLEKLAHLKETQKTINNLPLQVFFSVRLLDVGWQALFAAEYPFSHINRFL